MRRDWRAIALIASVAAIGCGGSPPAGTTTPRASVAASAPVVPSEGSRNAPPPAAPETIPTAPSPESDSVPVEQEEILSIAPGFRPDPIVRRGRAGGPVSADTMGPECRGYVGALPSFVLKIDVAIPDLRVLVQMQGDATLVVQLADGRVLCSDDSEGLNPIVEGPFPPGRHRVYVGSYGESGVGTEFSLGVTTQRSLSTQALESLPPTP